MSSAAYIQDMLADPASETIAGPGEVANFYAGRNVLLTGGTGFLGQLLIERILRSCPNVNTLFLFVRAKKGKSAEERFKEFFDNVNFDRLRAEKPVFARKITLIEGELGEIGLGLSAEQRELLRSTHIVIHGAATVRFDQKLRVAANINVRGTQELLLLAKEMVDLKAFVHISTAYSYCASNVIEEKFYPPPIDSDKLLSLLDILDDASLDHVTPVLLGKWPNTYTFTKAIGEDVIRRSSKTLPLCIVRPSMVIATWKEPIAGWINNVYGPTGIVIAAALGLVHTLYGDGNLVADIIPADYVVNNIIVAAWDIGKAHDQREKVNTADISSTSKIEALQIYNAVSSSQKPIKWAEFLHYIEEFGIPVSSIHCIWYPYFKINKYRWVHDLSTIFLHLVPAAIVDGLARLTGRKPMLWDAYKKIHKFSSVIEYFTMREWQFHNNNSKRLWESLGPADRRDFDFNVENLDWGDYFYHYLRGLRVYIVKDPLDTVPQGQSRYVKQQVAHYTLVTVLCGILLWVFWLIFRFIGLW